MTFELTPKTMLLIALAVVAVLGLVVLLPVVAIQAVWNAGSSYSGFGPSNNRLAGGFAVFGFGLADLFERFG